jgi:hypothetical protein
VGVCAYWCGGVGVVCVVDCGVVVVGVVNVVCFGVGGCVVVASIVVGGNWGSGGAVWGVWAIVVGIVDVVGVGGVVGGVLLLLLLPSEFPSVLVPSSYLTISGSHLLNRFLLGL